jgi:hypothetical protein
MKFLEKMLKINKMEQKFVCKFCDKRFHKEKTLATHMCVKKRRFMDIDSTGSKLGLRAFQKFYEMTTAVKKEKTVEDFINSDYYIGFVRFGNHLALLKPLYTEKFIDFIIKNAIPLDKWTKDDIYYAYINDLVKTEPAESATVRTLETIIKWCDGNNTAFVDFFENVSANEAAFMIKTGKLSPWVLYLSANGDILLNKFTEDHTKMFKEIVDASFWAKKFKKQLDDVKYIKDMLQQASL